MSQEVKIGDTVLVWNDETGDEWGPTVLVKTYRRSGSRWWVGADGSRFTTECISELNGLTVSW